MERTLSIVKPDGVGKGLIGEVARRFEKAGIRICAMKMVHLSMDQAKGFYAVHRERPFYESLLKFLTAGPTVAMVWEGREAVARAALGEWSAQSRKLLM